MMSRISKKADKQQKEDEADTDKDNPKALPLQHDMDKNASKGSFLLDARYEPSEGHRSRNRQAGRDEHGDHRGGREKGGSR